MLLSDIIRKGNGSSILCLMEGSAFLPLQCHLSKKEDARKYEIKTQISTSYCLLLYSTTKQ